MRCIGLWPKCLSEQKHPLCLVLLHIMALSVGCAHQLLFAEMATSDLNRIPPLFWNENSANPKSWGGGKKKTHKVLKSGQGFFFFLNSDERGEMLTSGGCLAILHANISILHAAFQSPSSAISWFT